VFAVISLIAVSIRKGSIVAVTSAVSAVSAAYVLFGTYFLSEQAQKAFSSTMSKIQDSPFSAIAKNFVKEIALQPEMGLYALVALGALAFLTSFYRRSQA